MDDFNEPVSETPLSGLLDGSMELASVLAAADQVLAETRESSGGAAGAEFRRHLRAMRARVAALEERVERLEQKLSAADFSEPPTPDGEDQLIPLPPHPDRG